MDAVSVLFWQQYSHKFGGKPYTYINRQEGIEVGDLVVVLARDELKVVKVSSIDAETDDEKVTYKEVLCKLDI
jgi:hypothetical protein|tara:strand:+ start:1524 stop:1742 length:219 start_codon:yes stop_codon:yes gene_type:complete